MRAKDKSKTRKKKIGIKDLTPKKNNVKGGQAKFSEFKITKIADTATP
jgi:hypothetical protein